MEKKVLYGQNGKAAKPESKSINDRTKRSMIGLRVKTTVDLARQLRKCTGYMLPSLVCPAISSTKLASFVIRHSAGQKRAGSRDHTYVQHFCPFLWLHTVVQSRINFMLQPGLHALVVQCSDAMFCQFLEVSIFLTFFCPIIQKIETSRNWQNTRAMDKKW